MLKVHSIETFGTHEGPGIRLVVFVQGCNFRCLYCHNPDSQDITGEAREMTSEEIIELLNRQKEYFKNKGGLTVSGGEPTLQVRGMIDLFQKVKEAGFNTVLDTNGSIVSSKVSELYALTDLVLLDVKHINPDLHKKITGHSNESVLHNAKLREESGKPMWLRYVLVPGYSNQEEYLYIWCEHFKNYKQVERVEILPYHTLGVYKYEALGRKYELSKVKPPNPEEVEKVKDIFCSYFNSVYIR